MQVGITFSKNHSDNFDAENGIISPFLDTGTYVLPVPILSSGSTAVIYHQTRDLGVTRQLMRVEYDDDHPDLTIIVSDRERIEWGCTTQTSLQDNAEPYQ